MAWRRDALLALAIAAGKLAAGLYVLGLGFTHVSDDDYCRVVLAQAFAGAPALDPTRTSWLPFPFWTMGGAMMVFGTSLAVARAVALASGVAGAVMVYGALRAAGASCRVAVGATVTAMVWPWNVWLGAAMVPEALTASLVAAAALGWPWRKGRMLLGAALLAAAWSRYEAWPACAVMVILGVVDGIRARDHRSLTAAGLAAAGPLLWMAWNAATRGSATDFLARVVAYRAAHGGGGSAAPLLPRLFGYPLALWQTSWPLLVLAGAGTAGLVMWRQTAALKRLAPAGLVAAATLAFLIYGDVNDGAPTHHPERAIVPLTWLLAAAGWEGISAATTRATTRGRAPGTVLIAFLVVGLLAQAARVAARYPARASDEDRAPQIARGLDLRQRDVAHVEITPCAFEHYALLAAFRHPERVTVHKSNGGVPSAACPLVDEH